jgi:hypothetical protein
MGHSKHFGSEIKAREANSSNPCDRVAMLTSKAEQKQNIWLEASPREAKFERL